MILAASSDAGGVCRWHLREAAAPRRAKARCPTFLSALRDSHRPARLRRLLHGCWGERLRRLRSHESSRVVKHEGRVPFFCDGWTHVDRTPADNLDRADIRGFSKKSDRTAKDRSGRRRTGLLAASDAVMSTPMNVEPTPTQGEVQLDECAGGAGAENRSPKRQCGGA